MRDVGSGLPPLIILTAPRSFSSLVCSMLGQHPSLYSLPETNLFVAGTLGEMMSLFRMIRPRSLDGLYRSVGQIEFHGQTGKHIAQSMTWLEERHSWGAREVLGYLGQHVGSRRFIDKSPSTAITRHGLANVFTQFPDAYFLHLTRHPVSTTLSIHRLKESKAGNFYESKAGRSPEEFWVTINTNIIRFADRLPFGQYMHVRGEDILSSPEVFLPQVCEWLGFGCDATALDAMLHPENSPYACIGPREAPFGNDPNFLRNPVYARREIDMPAMDAPLLWRSDAATLQARTRELAAHFGYT